MNKPFIFGFPVMFGVAGLWWLVPHGSSHARLPNIGTTRHAKLAADPSVPQAAFTVADRSSPQPNQPSVTAARPDGEQPSVPTAPATSAESARSDDTIWIGGEAMSREEVAFRLEANFREDGASDAAGRALERRISTQFSGQGALNATLNKAECRNRLCRIDLVAADKHAASKAFEGLYRGALIEAGGALAPIYESLPDGQTRIVIYAARQGALDVR